MDKRIRSAMGADFDYKVEYINTIQYFIFHTRTGKVAYVHKFLICNPSSKSRAAYLLLRNKLRAQDDTWKNIRGVKHKWLKFREEFLRQHKKVHNSFVCEYCGRPDLHNSKFNNDWLVTLDHIMPLSKGGEMFERSNLAVCCNLCNKVKKAFSLKEFEGCREEYLRGQRKKFNYKG